MHTHHSDGRRRPDTDTLSPFSRPGRYAYDLFIRERGDGRMGWEVTPATDGRVTVAFHYELADVAFDTTVTGGPATVREELLATPAEPFVTAALFPSVLPVSADGEPTVGERFSFSLSAGEASVETTGEHTYAGISGHTSVWTVDEKRRYEDCIATDLGLVLRATYYTRASTAAFLRLEITDCERA